MPDMAIPFADVNADGVVDQADLLLVFDNKNYNKVVDVGLGFSQRLDVNSDGKVNFSDAALVRNSRNFWE